MDIEAILIIGGLCAVLGVILIVPALWWARHKARKNPAYRKKVRFTFFGWIYLFIALSFLLAGLMMPYFLPDSYIGQLTSKRFGRLIWALFIGLLFTGLQKVLSSFGVLIEKPEKENKSV